MTDEDFLENTGKTESQTTETPYESIISQNSHLIAENFIDAMLSFIRENPNQTLLDGIILDLEAPLRRAEFFYQARVYLRMMFIDREIPNVFDQRVITYVDDAITRIPQESNLEATRTHLTNLQNLMHSFHSNYNTTTDEDPIRNILEFITTNVDSELLNEEDINQITTYLRSIFIDEDLLDLLDQRIIDLITPIIGTTDNPLSTLGNVYSTHLERIEHASIEYDEFEINSNNSSEQIFSCDEDGLQDLEIFIAQTSDFSQTIMEELHNKTLSKVRLNTEDETYSINQLELKALSSLFTTPQENTNLESYSSEKDIFLNGANIQFLGITFDNTKIFLEVVSSKSA